MKVKNLFSCVALLGAMALSSCGQQPHSHNPGEHGFCSCGIYMGETLELIEHWDSEHTVWSYDELMKSFGMLEQDQDYHCRVMAKNLHSYYFVDSDFVNKEDVKAFIVNEAGQIVNYQLGDGETFAKLELGPDGYLYIDAKVKAGDNTTWFEICGDHYYAEAGVCEHDGQFVTTQGQKKGHVIPMGSYKAEFINVAIADGGADFYQFTEDTNTHNPLFGGHKLEIAEVTNIPENSLSMYYVDNDNKTHHVTKNDKIPVGIGQVYVALAHDGPVTNGSFRVKIHEHADAQHGLCPYCDQLMNGTLELIVNESYSDPFDMHIGNAYYFGVNVATPETKKFTIQFSAGENILEPTAGTFNVYYWNGEQFDIAELESAGYNEATYVVPSEHLYSNYMMFEIIPNEPHLNVKAKAVFVE